MLKKAIAFISTLALILACALPVLSASASSGWKVDGTTNTATANADGSVSLNFANPSRFSDYFTYKAASPIDSLNLEFTPDGQNGLPFIISFGKESKIPIFGMGDGGLTFIFEPKEDSALYLYTFDSSNNSSVFSAYVWDFDNSKKHTFGFVNEDGKYLLYIDGTAVSDFDFSEYITRIKTANPYSTFVDISAEKACNIAVAFKTDKWQHFDENDGIAVSAASDGSSIISFPQAYRDRYVSYAADIAIDELKLNFKLDPQNGLGAIVTFAAQATTPIWGMAANSGRAITLIMEKEAAGTLAVYGYEPWGREVFNFTRNAIDDQKHTLSFKKTGNTYMLMLDDTPLADFTEYVYGLKEISPNGTVISISGEKAQTVNFGFSRWASYKDEIFPISNPDGSETLYFNAQGDDAVYKDIYNYVPYAVDDLRLEFTSNDKAKEVFEVSFSSGYTEIPRFNMWGNNAALSLLIETENNGQTLLIQAYQPGNAAGDIFKEHRINSFDINAKHALTFVKEGSARYIAIDDIVLRDYDYSYFLGNLKSISSDCTYVHLASKAPCTRVVKLGKASGWLSASAENTLNINGKVYDFTLADAAVVNGEIPVSAENLQLRIKPQDSAAIDLNVNLGGLSVSLIRENADLLYTVAGTVNGRISNVDFGKDMVIALEQDQAGIWCPVLCGVRADYDASAAVSQSGTVSAVAISSAAAANIQLTTTIWGDVNDDDSLDAQDLVALRKNLLLGGDLPYGDVNLDNSVDIKDLVRLKKLIVNTAQL